MYGARIAAGIEYLEKEEDVTDWREKLADVDLDMWDAGTCVIGRLFDEYWYHIDVNNLSEEWALKHGFNLPDGSAREEYDQLTEEWKAVIAGADPASLDAVPETV